MPSSVDTTSSVTPAAPSARERLLALRRRAIDSRGAAVAPIDVRADAVAPVSHAQQALWFIERLGGSGSAYNTSLALRLRGPLDREAMGDAYATLLRRHAALRTGFVAPQGVPMQVVHDLDAVRMPTVDLGSATDDVDAIERRLERAIALEVARAFDIETAPLARATLFALAADHHVLLVVVHHLVVDGWSRDLMARELAALYVAFAAGPDRRDPLPAAPIAYTDFARWQRARTETPAFARSLDWWSRQLDGLEPVTVPADHVADAAPAAAMRPAARVRFEVPADTVRGLRALARAEGATLFMVLLAAFDVLLMRWSGRTDIAVGTPVAGRLRPELEPVVGCFANMLVLRTDLSGRPRFRELLARARRTTLDALDHQEVPFDLVAAQAASRRAGDAPGANPLFGVSFGLRNLPAGTVEIPGIACTPLAPAAAAAKFDLSVGLAEVGERLDGEFEYASDSYASGTAERLVEQYLRLLAGVVADPDAAIGALPTISDAERHHLLVTLDDSAAPFPDDRCVHELVAERVRATPEAIAVVCGDRRLTYGELDARAERLARTLAAYGVAAGTLVGVCLPRSERTIVALLAALKAGAGYLPLDPRTPPDRLEFVLDDARPRVLIAEPALARRLPARVRDAVPVIDVDGDGDAPVNAARPDCAPRRDAGSRDLAYVIYTSGSTGRPKGVQIEHRGLVNNLAWQIREFGFGPHDRFLQRTSFTFDASCWELWTPLCVGATQVVATDDELADPADTIRLIVEHGLTFAQMVPSFLALLLSELERAPTALPLRLMTVGGEALPASDVRRWQAVSDATLVNCYGPTESTIDATFERCTAERATATPTIGRPMANTRVLMLDPSGAPTPRGGIGELHIGGVGLARGYLNRDALTAERFVSDPFRPGERLYRSGDLGRLQPDGRIEFHGRIDQQVKLRGFRIELGEVEAALAALPGVERASALVRSDAAGTPRLVGYVQTGGPRDAADAARMRSLVAQRLPDYMVPAAIVVLERLPELASGKLDRNAFPEPPLQVAATGSVAPRSPLEETLAEIWSQVLGVERVGAHDDFFALGGNSLLAARAMNRIRAVLGIDPGIRAIFESPTVAGLAGTVGNAGDAGAMRDEPLIAGPEPDGTPAPLDAVQRALAFVERYERSDSLYNIPEAVRLRGPLDADALRDALTALTARHGALRTRFELGGDAPCQVVEPVRAFAMDTVATTGDALRDALRREAAVALPLARAPLVRAVLFALAPDDHVLLLVFHHAVVDGWSMKLIATELGELYSARIEHRASHLATPPVRFVDYAAWRQRRLERPVSPEPGAPTLLALRLEWWRERLQGLEPLPLPFDRPRRADAGTDGGQVEVVLPADVAARLRALALAAGATPFMGLLAAFKMLLARWCGRADVVVGTPVAGRDRVEVESVVGCFVNMVVLRTDLSGEPAFDEVMARVRDTTVDAFMRQDAPFDRLVVELAPRREPGVNPLYQVAFTFETEPQPTAALAGLICEPVAIANEAAKFDLALAIQGRADGTLGCTFDFRAALFDRSSIEALAERFAATVGAAIAAPATPFGRLPLERGERGRRLLALGRGADAPAARHGGIAARFAVIADRHPDALAVIDGTRRLGYRELDARADRLARRLLSLGTAPGEIVALSAARSAEHVVAMLAIVKAGAAYLPVDPGLPAERIATMLSDCAVRTAIVDGSGACLPAPGRPGGVRRVAAAFDAPELDGVPDAPVLVEREPSSLAYVIFTSGSSGRPKGVRIPQSGVLRLTVDADYAVLGPGRVIGQASTCAFDAATFEIWGALLTGAALAVVPRDTLLDPDALAAQLRGDRIDTLFLTTALFNAHAERRPALFAPLATLLFGGEAADARAVRRVLESGAPPRRLVNVYGPTEVTTFATWHDVSAAHGADPSTMPARVPIGRPIAGTVCRVIDRFGGLAPIGTVGELHLGGPGMSLGYLGRPDADAHAFVDDLHEPGARLYRTGDLVRWTEAGTLEFAGRIDDQVKIRGFRIEPGEVEVAVRGCAGVRDAVVLVHEAAPGDRRLIAYVVPERDDDDALARPLTARRLRTALRDVLPEFMLPSAFVTVAALPLTANGKVDRRMLPDPGQALAAETAVRRAGADPVPGDGLEARLAAVWQQVLGRGTVEPDDDFFALGGHSLMAMRLLAVIEREFGHELPLATLFEAPTVRALAAVLRTDARARTRSCVVPVNATGDRPPLFFVSGWGGALLVFAELARALGPEQPLYVLDTAAFGADDIGDGSLPSIAARMLADMRAARPDGPYQLCGFSLGGKFVHEIARQLREQGTPAALLALMDCHAPGYPRRRPMPARIALHLRELLRLGPVGAWRHVSQRARYLAARRRGERERLFAAGTAIADSAVGRSMQASADAMLRVWEAFEPGPCADRILVIRAARRELRPSLIEDDPALGWSELAGGGVDLRALDCHHRRMLDPEHAPELADALREFLAPAPRRAAGRRDAPVVVATPKVAEVAEA